jgi:thiol-disulfide isomerase/thioredoxin
MKPSLSLMAAAAALLTPSLVHADPQAVALLRKVQASEQAAQSLTADLIYTVKFPGEAVTGIPDKATVKLMKPNYAAVVLPSPPGSPPNVIASDGASTYTFTPRTASYLKTPTLPGGGNIHVWDSIVVQAFFDTPNAVKDWIYVDDLNALTYAGTETVDGTSYRVLIHLMTGTLRGKSCPFVQRLYIGPDDLIHRYRLDFTYDGKPGVEIADLRNIRLNASLTSAEFAFTPPADAKIVTPPAPPPALLDAGATAPDFTVQDKDGKPVKLSDYQGKVVVLDFWATWCGPCQASLPHTNEIAHKYGDKGVVVLAVNTSDSHAAFLKWLPQHAGLSGLTFAIDPAASNVNVATTLYGVTGIPTQFIIDRNGKIVKTLVGYGGPNSDLENAITAAGA